MEVLDHPEPPPVVELDRDRLADHRLGGEELDLKARSDFEMGQSLIGTERRLGEGD